MMNPMRPIHPGEILREEFLAPLGLSANALAIELKVPAPRIRAPRRIRGARAGQGAPPSFKRLSA
jgi:antitoxin HigA-1